MPESSLSGDYCSFPVELPENCSGQAHTRSHTLCYRYGSGHSKSRRWFGSKGTGTPRRNQSSSLEFLGGLQLCPLREDVGMKIASPTQQTVVMAHSGANAVMGSQDGCSYRAVELRARAESSIPRGSLKLLSLTLLPQIGHFQLALKCQFSLKSLEKVFCFCRAHHVALQCIPATILRVS